MMPLESTLPIRLVAGWALVAALTAGCDRVKPRSAEGASSSPPGASRQGTALAAAGGGASVQQTRPATAGRPARQASSALRTRPASTASEPAASQIASDDTSFRPLVDAAAGEWAEYVAMDSRILHYHVDSVTTTSVRTRVTLFERGKPLGLPATREDPRRFDPLARRAGREGYEHRITGVLIEAAGRRWAATCHEQRWLDEGIAYVRRTWVSRDVPVFGIIRMELYGDEMLEASLQLVAAGSASPASRSSAPPRQR